MHASFAFVNGAGSSGLRRRQPPDLDSLRLMNALLSVTNAESGGPSLDRTKSQDERQAEEENQEPTASKPGGFKNDPDDPKNPNEVRERHLQKIKR